MCMVEVVIPVKSFAAAKTRLEPFPRRAELSRAMVHDTVAAVTEVATRLVVVSDEPSLVALTTHSRCQLEILADPGGGLNAAVRAGDRHLGQLVSGAVRVAMVADLPALRPVDLAEAVTALAGRPYGLVVDADGTGTTMLLSSGPALAPAFGADSASRHRDGGAVALAVGPQARRDVDTLAALEDAISLGIGRHTRDVLSTTRLKARLG